MSERILIESIKTLRTLDPDDKVQPLAIDIRDSGQKVPVLLDEDYTLIDGLRRLEAVKMLGHETIEVVRATTLEEATDVLKLAHAGKPVDRVRRVWEIRKQLQRLLSERGSRQRQRQTGLPRGARVISKEEKWRWLFIDAMGGLKSADRIRTLYGMAEKNDALAQELVTRMENGEISPHAAYARYTRRTPLNGNIHSAKEQLAALENATRGLSGIMKALDKLGWPIMVSPEDRAPIIKELLVYRRQFYKLIHLLEEAEKE